MENPSLTHSAMAREVRRALSARGLTMAEVAARAGVTPTYLSRILAGRAGGSWALFDRLADALGARWSIELKGDEGEHAGVDPRVDRLRRAAHDQRRAAATLDALADDLGAR